MAKKTMDKYGRIDILINNAGQACMDSRLRKSILMNIKNNGSQCLWSHKSNAEVIPIMRKQGGGMILNVSSALTKMHIPYFGLLLNEVCFEFYLSNCREELKKDNIIVSLILPNMTDTNFHRMQ